MTTLTRWSTTLGVPRYTLLKIIFTNTSIGLNENIDINMTISKSPGRHTFQGTILDDDYLDDDYLDDDNYREYRLNHYKSARQQDEENIIDPEWQKNNMEYDLRTTDWILEKVRTSNIYAQNLYAAICNNNFQKLDVLPILKNQTWSASWRSAGGIIANMRQEGDYIDWYCSGMRCENVETNGYVPEQMVTDEIREDLNRLRWIVVDY